MIHKSHQFNATPEFVLVDDVATAALPVTPLSIIIFYIRYARDCKRAGVKVWYRLSGGGDSVGGLVKPLLPVFRSANGQPMRGTGSILGKPPSIPPRR